MFEAVGSVSEILYNAVLEKSLNVLEKKSVSLANKEIFLQFFGIKQHIKHTSHVALLEPATLLKLQESLFEIGRSICFDLLEDLS
jgi:hypothetical protein